MTTKKSQVAFGLKRFLNVPEGQSKYLLLAHKARRILKTHNPTRS